MSFNGIGSGMTKIAYTIKDLLIANAALSVPVGAAYALSEYNKAPNRKVEYAKNVGLGATAGGVVGGSLGIGAGMLTKYEDAPMLGAMLGSAVGDNVGAYLAREHTRSKKASVGNEDMSYGKAMALGAGATAAMFGGLAPLLAPNHQMKAIGLGALVGLGSGAAGKYVLDRSKKAAVVPAANEFFNMVQKAKKEDIQRRWEGLKNLEVKEAARRHREMMNAIYAR